jgi:hypothetical protein
LVSRGSAAIIDALLERGADSSAANAKGETPLALAETRTTPQILEQLRAAAAERTAN